MAWTDEDRDRLADYRLMYGEASGSFAFVLDQLTDVMALIAQHKVYCKVERGPRAGSLTADLEQSLVVLADLKELVQSAMAEARDA